MSISDHYRHVLCHGDARENNAEQSANEKYKQQEIILAGYVPNLVAEPTLIGQCTN